MVGDTDSTKRLISIVEFGNTAAWLHSMLLTCSYKKAICKKSNLFLRNKEKLTKYFIKQCQQFITITRFERNSSGFLKNYKDFEKKGISKKKNSRGHLGLYCFYIQFNSFIHKYTIPKIKI